MLSGGCEARPLPRTVSLFLRLCALVQNIPVSDFRCGPRCINRAPFCILYLPFVPSPLLRVFCLRKAYQILRLKPTRPPNTYLVVATLTSLPFLVLFPPPLPPLQIQAVLILARIATTARLSSSSRNIPIASIATATAVKRESEGDKTLRRRCPNALLVRAVEALGRVYMHREAAMVGDGNNLAGVGGGGSAEELQREEEEEVASMLQPMPFSVKMRELMVWATGTVLPVLVGSGGVGGDVVEDGGRTPGESYAE